MTRNASILLALLLISPEAAMAAPKGRGAPKPTDQADPAAAPGSRKLEAIVEKGKCKVPENPFKIEKPKNPENLTAIAPEATILEDQLPNMSFSYCKEVKSSASVPETQKSCDETLARVFKYVHESNQALAKLDAVCKQVEKDAKACESVDQTKAQKCIADIVTKAREQFEAVAKEYEIRSKDLQKRNADHLLVIKQLLPPILSAKKTTPPHRSLLARVLHPKAATTPEAYVLEAREGKTAVRPEQKRFCTTVGGTGEYCGHITAATDARFFARSLNTIGSDITKTAEALKVIGDQADNRANNNGPPGSPGDDTGGSKDSKKPAGGGMGLNDLMKLGTLGAMGAGMYCSITGKCGGGGDEKSSITDPAIAEQYPQQLTNPTPSEKHETQVSQLDGKKDGGSSALGSVGGESTKTDTSVPERNFGPNSGGGSYSGFGGLDTGSSGKGSPSLGSPGRDVASSGPVGGGGLGSGGGSTGGSEPSANSPPIKNDLLGDGFGSLGGGGGSSGGSGGFSLGDSPSMAATDDALKSVLNGDGLPPSDPGLAGLDGLGGETSAGEEGEIDGDGSLFRRVKAAYVRCAKRGCLVKEVGETI